MMQNRKFFTQGLEKVGGSITILNIRVVNINHEQKPKDIGHDMTFSSLDFL